MNPDIANRQLNAYVDGELDLTSQLEIEERLAQDAALRAQVDGLHQWRAALRDGADYHAAPSALRQRMVALVAAQATAKTAAAQPAPGQGAATGRQRWWTWRPMVAAFGLMAALTLGARLLGWAPAQDQRLLEEVVASHVRSTLSQHLVDVASSDHHTVKPWLSARLDFSPPVPELQSLGASFLGGRVDYFAGRPVAALVYRQGQHVLNSFVWPTAAADHAPAFSTERGFQIARWSRNGMNHWVISDVNREEFAAVVRGIEVADAER